MACTFLNLSCLGILFSSLLTILHASEISIVRENGKLIIRAGEDLFTQYIYKLSLIHISEPTRR